MQRNHNGFSLPEALVAMAIIAIGAGLGLPAFQGTLERQRAQTALHLVAAALANARSTAISQSIPVSVCPSQGDGYCLGGWDWSQGWIMYRDPNRQKQPAQAGDILRADAIPIHPSLRLVSSAGRQYIRFLPDGRSSGSNLRLRVCRDDKILGEVIVNNLGRIRSLRTPGTQSCA